MRLTGQKWRRKGRAQYSEPIGDASDPLLNSQLVAAALGRLTQEHRNVLGELCLRGSSVAQAADALGIAPGMVTSRTYYALRALRLAIEELRSIDTAGLLGARDADETGLG